MFSSCQRRVARLLQAAISNSNSNSHKQTMYITSNLETDGLWKQKTTLGDAPVTKKEHHMPTIKATIHTALLKLDDSRLEKEAWSDES